MKDDRLYLVHIQECIERIERYTTEGKDAFFDRASEIDWRGIVGFRNVLVHEYLGVDLKRVWDIVERDLPPLKREIENLL